MFHQAVAMKRRWMGWKARWRREGDSFALAAGNIQSSVSR